MPSHNKTQKNKNKKFTPSRKRSRGIRGELLPNDGLTFTTLTAIPRTIVNRSQTYNIVQSYSLPAFFSTSTSLNTFSSVGATFGNIDQAASLAVVFDQYRITELEVWLMPRDSAAATSSSQALLYSVIDLDDGTPLTTPGQFGDYTSCVTSEIDQGHYRHFIPHVAMAAYSGAFTSFANVASPWIDTSSPSVIHYGVKFGAGVTGTSHTYDVNLKLHIQLRSVR